MLQKNARRQPFGGLETYDSSSTFHFYVSRCRPGSKRREKKEREKKRRQLIPRRTGVVAERVEAFGEKVATQTVRLAAVWCGRLIASCIYEFTTGVSFWVHAVTEDGKRGGGGGGESGSQAGGSSRSELLLPSSELHHACFSSLCFFSNLALKRFHHIHQCHFFGPHRSWSCNENWLPCWKTKFNAHKRLLSVPPTCS